jgi:uncharacterized membrane protein YgaE (UPF0421/DUF939 family)
MRSQKGQRCADAGSAHQRAAVHRLRLGSAGSVGVSGTRKLAGVILGFGVYAVMFAVQPSVVPVDVIVLEMLCVPVTLVMNSNIANVPLSPLTNV